MPACIYYHPDAYTTQGPKLMGRNAAGESFFQGYLRSLPSEEVWLFAEKPQYLKGVSDYLGQRNPSKSLQAIGPETMAALQRVGTLYYPGPDIGPQAWRRQVLGRSLWSICGITHTTSSAGAMDSIASLIEAPIQPWDALICTSQAVKRNVTTVLQAQVDYLKNRLGITKIVLPQLPVIPLGINTDQFAFSEEQRQQSRRALGLDPGEIAVLFMGRLSFHAKAHPVAMYQALEAAAQQTKQKIVLIECGWFANDFIQKAFSDAAAQYAPSVRVMHLDGREKTSRDQAWSSADVFCSLSDNIQETFGITPIEAMAAGLPVVVSDWDGYKDTVRQEIDGFRIPTTLPAPGLAGDLATRHAYGVDTYDMYCGYACSLCSVDIDQATQAFTALFGSKDLRKKMGEEGRKRAQSVYDWSSVMVQYEQLWAELASTRKASTDDNRASIWPARLDPTHSFGHYASNTLTLQTVVCLRHANAEEALSQLDQALGMASINFAAYVIPAKPELQAVLRAIGESSKSCEEVLQVIPEPRRPYVLRAIVWLMKYGLVRGTSR